MNIHANTGSADPSGRTDGTGLPSDTRGIIDPVEMMRWVDFDRRPAGDVLDGVIGWFWSVTWDLPADRHHDQEVLNHPAGNVSIGTVDDAGVPLDPAPGRVYGVMTGLSHRHLVDAGWNVAARTAVGGLGVLLDAPATSATDRQLDLGAVPGLDAERLLVAVRAADAVADRIDLLRDALVDVVDRRDPALRAEAREVVAVTDLAEHDRSVCRVEQLASAAGWSVRTLQRLFDQHVGVSPSFVIRRWRIIEAAEAARAALDADTEWPGWAQVAAELGYADQAHLARDFRRHLGTTPSAHLARTTAPRT